MSFRNGSKSKRVPALLFGCILALAWRLRTIPCGFRGIMTLSIIVMNSILYKQTRVLGRSHAC